MTSNGPANGSFYQSTNSNSSTSTLRPRNNLSRLISYEDGPPQHETIATSTSTLTSTSSTPHSSDLRSTPHSAAGARAHSKGKPQAAQFRDPSAQDRNVFINNDRRPSGGIWDSWSSFQGIASSFLGSDQSGPTIHRTHSAHKSKSGRMLQDKSYGLKQSQAEWGPDSQQAHKAISIEDQKASLQAKKREALLQQSVEVKAGKDSLGKYKRKDSDASVRSSSVQHPNDGDVLVYRHKVQPSDTVAGVVIKYSCQPEAFRKANRFWPNDNIQRRDYVVIPVDACSVRGRKTEGPYVADLLHEDKKTENNTSSITSGTANSIKTSDTNPTQATEPFPRTDAPASQLDSDAPYKHDCWVFLPNNPQSVEILRISKRALGYFPPARRKSQSNSATSTPFSDSTATTPKSSFDMLRHPPTHAAQQAQLSQHLQATLGRNSSPIRQPSMPRYLSESARTRSNSTVSTSNDASANAFLSALSGPGGVGALRGLRTERARPGPGEDSLNRKFAQYAPDLLPQDHPDYQGSSSLLKPPRPRTANTSLRATPRASIDSIRSTRSNSSSMPAAIAGWVGKVASSPMRKKDLNRGDLNLGVLEELDTRAGDLIELADTPDEVSRQLHDAVDAEERTPTATPTISGDDERIMNERFPIRGRVRRAYQAD